jgi:hypothetical protein
VTLAPVSTMSTDVVGRKVVGKALLRSASKLRKCGAGASAEGDPSEEVG